MGYIYCIENKRNAKRISQYNKDDVLIHTYNSIAEASRKTKISLYEISRCLNDKTEFAGDFRWKLTI